MITEYSMHDIYNYLSAEAGVEIDDNTDLISHNILTSLRLLGLVVILEKVRGVAIEPDDIDMEKMRTLKQIKSNYLSSVISPLPA